MFKNKRFGMFIHWGLYSQGARHEQEMWRFTVDSETYNKYIKEFNPTEYNPYEWVKLAKECGFDYITFTTKHHDGFCMWDTKYTDYKITNTPYGKDVLKMLADACHKEGIGLSLYYSVPDWHHPDYPNTTGHHEVKTAEETPDADESVYIEYVKNQLFELLTGYGKIQSFFWDIPPRTRDKSLNELIRSLQPGILINNRGYDDGDFSTPERMSADGASFDGLCEACDSIGKESWGYRGNEDYHTNLYLTSSIDRYMAMGANFVLNAGPDSLGRIPDTAKEILKDVGSWYKNVKEALYAKPVKYEWASKKGFLTTRDGNTLYLHIPSSPDSCGFYIPEIKELPVSATVLNDGTKLISSMDKMPSMFNGQKNCLKEVCHIYGIPANKLSSQAIIIKMEFENLDEAISTSSSEQAKRIL